MKISKLFPALLISSICFLYILLCPFPTHAEVAEIAHDVTISVSLGEPRLTVFGYGPPNAKVVLQGNGIYAETASDKNGYFIFQNKFAPLSKNEICIVAYDSHGGSTQPVCLPPLPANRRVTVGPIILPPIVQLNSGGFTVNDFAVIKGSTVPNTDVSLNIFSSDLGENDSSGISLPQLNTKSDNEGNFNISIPTNYDQRLRFFAQTTFDDIDSGKSTTLTVDIEPLWMKILRSLWNLLTPLKGILIYIIILAEFAFLIWFFLVHKKKKHELMVIEETPLATRSTASDDH